MRLTKVYGGELMSTLLRISAVALALSAAVRSQVIPNTGQQITPLAPSGAKFMPLIPGLADNPTWVAGQAVTSISSPDHKTLLVLTSGYNRVNYTSGPKAGSRNPADSNEYVFVYDISNGAPVQKQVLQVSDTGSSSRTPAPRLLTRILRRR